MVNFFGAGLKVYKVIVALETIPSLAFTIRALAVRGRLEHRGENLALASGVQNLFQSALSFSPKMSGIPGCLRG